MKRSQIIGIIEDAFDDCLDIPNDSYITKKQYGEYILTKLEEAGMIPPKTKIEATHTEFEIDNRMKEGGWWKTKTYLVSNYEWESEDE